VDGNGKSGKAMSFDGVDDQVTVNYSNFTLTGSYTVFVYTKANFFGNCGTKTKTAS
jgi:hypothetical protein